MKKFTFLTFVLFFICISLFAQTTALQKQSVQKIKPMFIVEDMIFIFQTLNTIEIKGTEADAFIVVRNVLQGAIQKAQEGKKNVSDSVEVEMGVSVAQDLVNLLQRAKFAGANADKYKRFTDAIYTSAKMLSPNQE